MIDPNILTSQISTKSILKFKFCQHFLTPYMATLIHLLALETPTKNDYQLSTWIRLSATHEGCNETTTYNFPLSIYLLLLLFNFSHVSFFKCLLSIKIRILPLFGRRTDANEYKCLKWQADIRPLRLKLYCFLLSLYANKLSNINWQFLFFSKY